MTATEHGPGTADPVLDAAEAAVRRRFRAGSGPVGDPVAHLGQLLQEEAPLLAAAEVDRRARRLAVELVGLGPIQDLLDSGDVTDVLVNGPGDVWVERSGQLCRSGVVVDRPAIDRAVERLVGPLGLRADRAHPIVDARLADGTRVTVVLPPLAVDGPLVAVRRHRSEPVALERLADPAVVEVLVDRVRRRRNVVVYGGTGSGKTTLLNALGSLLPAGERVVTVEDVAELRLPGDGVVRLEARPGTADGVGRVAIRDLVRAALRLRPDRIVVGEVRGAEAADMVWAMSTGHDGSMSTVHASSPEDALRRLESFAVSAGDGVPPEVVRAQVRSAVQVLVGVARSGGGARRVVRIDDVDGLTGRPERAS
jgi:pilus assembly protein CpaF